MVKTGVFRSFHMVHPRWREEELCHVSKSDEIARCSI
jgi:hypothetical protein